MDARRRLGRLAAAAMCALALAGCASMRVSSFQARGFDFTQYRTYNWAPDDQLATGDPRLDNNSFFLERLQSDVERQLSAAGFEKTTSGTPELLLHYHARISQRLDVTSADQKYGSCQDCASSVYEAGTILLDIVDTRTGKLAWRGWAEGSIDGAIDNQEWMEEKIDEAVTRILARLPRRS
jgi:hypothetical protein